MTTTEKGRTRPRLIRLAAGVTLAGVTLGVFGTGVTQAQTPPVSPPLNVGAAEVAGPALNIDWDAPTTGARPTYYRLVVDNVATAATEFTTFVPATQTEYLGLFAVPNTTYSILVESNDENTFAAAAPVTVTTRASSLTVCPTGEWAPFCTVDAFIRQQYRDWENRAPSLDELNFWRAYLQPRNVLPGGTQDQFLDNLRQHKDIVAGPTTRLYIAYFLRNPEFAGYTFWLNAVESGAWSMAEVSEFFARSPEFVARYGALDNAEFVSLVYQNVLGRNPDAAGFAFWTRQLQAGQTRGWMMMQFTEAPSLEFQGRTRIAVAATEVWAEMLNRTPTIAEYDQASFLMATSTYPLSPAEVNPLYTGVMARAEYAARITAR